MFTIMCGLFQNNVCVKKVGLIRDKINDKQVYSIYKMQIHMYNKSHNTNTFNSKYIILKQTKAKCNFSAIYIFHFNILC